jgi:hypothetical protein
LDYPTNEAVTKLVTFTYESILLELFRNHHLM